MTGEGAEVSGTESRDVVEVPRAVWEAIEARLAQLEHAVGVGAKAPVAAAADGLTDRRGLLKHGAVLAAGAVAGGAALVAAQAAPAAATTGTMQYGTSNNAGSDHTDLFSSSTDYVLGLHMTTTEGTGACLSLDDSNGSGFPGVGYLVSATIQNTANPFPAIDALSNGSGPGVSGYAKSAGVLGAGSVGVLGQATGTGFGVVGNDNDAFNDKAGTGGGVQGQLYNPNNSSVAVEATTAGTGNAIDARITNGSSEAIAIFATTVGSGAAIYGQQTSGLDAAAVYGDSFISGGPGVQGVSGNTGVAGVLGSGAAGPGVEGDSGSPYPGVFGSSIGTGHGVEGQITNAASAANGVYGTTNGTGSGVAGLTTSATGAGVSGVSNASGYYGVGVVGTQNSLGSGVVGKSTSGNGVYGTTTNGIGVYGVSTTARGGQFSGGPAQIRLIPGTASTHPASGKAGDIYLDSTSRLWLCTVTSTTTATWKQIQVA